MWKYVVELFVGLLRGWYAEYSRDQAHEDKGKLKTNLEYQNDALSKISAADAARHSLDPSGVRYDPNNRDN